MSDEAKLLDFDWIAAELQRSDPYALLHHYADPPADLPQEAVALVRDALRLSAAALEKDKHLLPGQLLGRLTAWEAGWGDLPAQIAAWEGYAWLRPLQPMLTPAGGALLYTLQAHQETVLQTLFTAGCRQAVTIGNRDPVIRIWELSSGRLLRELCGGEAGINAVLLLKDGASLLAADAAGTLRRWDIPSGEMRFQLPVDSSPLLRLAVDDEETILCAAAESGRLTMVDPALGEVRQQVGAHKSAIRYLFMQSDLRQAISVGDDRHVKTWSTESGEVQDDWSVLKELADGRPFCR